MFRYRAVTGRRAVERRVVHQHDHAVAGHARVDLEKGGDPTQRMFECPDAVFGTAVLAASAMPADYGHVRRTPVAEIFAHGADAVDRQRTQPGIG